MSWGQGSWPAIRVPPPRQHRLQDRVVGPSPAAQGPGRRAGRVPQVRAPRRGGRRVRAASGGRHEGRERRPQARSRLPRGRAASAFPGVAVCGGDPWPRLSGRGARGRGRGSGGRGGRWGRGCRSSGRSPATAGGGAAEGGGPERAGCRRGRFWKSREQRVSG